MMSRKAFQYIGLAVLLIGGGVWIVDGVQASAATRAEQLKKPVGYEQKAYNLNPEPKLKDNTTKKAEFDLKKDKILKKLQVGTNEKVNSTELKAWKEYNALDGQHMKNFEVDDNRLVWVVKLDCPDGVDTRGGFYRNATKLYVVDAENENIIEMRVQGELDPQTGPYNNPVQSVIEK